MFDLMGIQEVRQDKDVAEVEFGTIQFRIFYLPICFLNTQHFNIQSDSYSQNTQAIFAHIS